MNLSASFSTGQHHGYSVRYSPFRKNILAVATSELYGLRGQGLLYMLDTANGNNIHAVCTLAWKDVLFDVTWSEVNPDLVATCSGDGSVQIWDFTKSYGNFCKPVAFQKLHSKEVCSIEWSPKNAYNCILTASWDQQIKMWNPFVLSEVQEFIGHSGQVNQVCFSHQDPAVFASASADNTLKLWDIRDATGPKSEHAHDLEVTCCDWNRTDPIIATGTAGGKIYEWDVRKMSAPFFVLSGHEYAIRRVKFSPLQQGLLASVSYDHTTRFWKCDVPTAIDIQSSHTEFVFGLDFNPLKQGQVCDCSWDSSVCIYEAAL